jgi:hypothetical protein
MQSQFLIRNELRKQDALITLGFYRNEIMKRSGCNDLNPVDIFEYENGAPRWIKI